MIVGGGFAGMLTAIDLGKHGITDFRIVEKAGDFGGTWYWNRYPGCMCDVESYTYLPLLEETGYMPTERYASATEIFEYCQAPGPHLRPLPPRPLPDRRHRSRLGRGGATLAGHHQPRRPAFGLVPGVGRGHSAQSQVARHPRDRGLRGQGLPHQPLGLQLHRRQPHRADGQLDRQERRHHRHRCHRRAGGAPARPCGQGALRLPAHPGSGGRPQPAAHRGRVVPEPRARLAEASGSSTSPRP